MLLKFLNEVLTEMMDDNSQDKLFSYIIWDFNH